MDVVGVIPAAGRAERLQPLRGSKEVLPVGGKPVMDYLVANMRAGGCTHLRVVTREGKRDVIRHARELGAETVIASPRTVSESILAGTEGLAAGDVLLIGFPDTIWDPRDGYAQLIREVVEGCDVALGLFRIAPAELSRCDVVVFGEENTIEQIDVKPRRPRSDWIWGCAAVRADIAQGLCCTDWPGGYFDLLCREGASVKGVRLSDVWLDIGTKEALSRAEEFVRDRAGRRHGSGLE
jgi:glucose-1-phosphate thymidylyltransferase